MEESSPLSASLILAPFPFQLSISFPEEVRRTLVIQSPESRTNIRNPYGQAASYLDNEEADLDDQTNGG
jgi:hypothetical protein